MGTADYLYVRNTRIFLEEVGKNIDSHIITLQAEMDKQLLTAKATTEGDNITEWRKIHSRLDMLDRQAKEMKKEVRKLQDSLDFEEQSWYREIIRSLEVSSMAITIGFGDRVPRSPVGKAMAALQGVVGLLLFGFIVGLVVYLATVFLQNLRPPPLDPENGIE